jgi:hypothetical protein
MCPVRIFRRHADRTRGQGVVAVPLAEDRPAEQARAIGTFAIPTAIITGNRPGPIRVTIPSASGNPDREA